MLGAKEKERKKTRTHTFIDTVSSGIFLKCCHNLKVLSDLFLGKMTYMFIKIKIDISLILII